MFWPPNLLCRPFGTLINSMQIGSADENEWNMQKPFQNNLKEQASEGLMATRRFLQREGRIMLIKLLKYSLSATKVP